MPVLDIEPGQNPNAPGVLSFGSQGQAPGLLVDTEGNLTLLGALVVASLTISGNLTVAGNLTVGGTITSTGQIAAGDAVNVRRTNSFDNAFSARDTDDPFLRYQVSCEGNIQMGDGQQAPDVNLYRLSSNNLATDDNLILTTAGRSLRIKEGTNACMGRATLVGGTVVVNTTAVSAASEIFLTCQTPGGTPGFLRVSARAAGTSFTILSSSGTDTSVVAWMIVEPSP